MRFPVRFLRFPAARPGSGGSRPGAPLLALLLLSGCDRDTTELIREIDAAREGCTQEKLQTGAEECVRMMERYAEMGNEAIQTYIGAVRSLDQALQRMPAPAFDTAGLGHAFSRPPARDPGAWDSLPAPQGAFAPDPDDPARQRWPSAQPVPEGWGEPVYRRDQGGYAPSAYDRPAPYPGAYRGEPFGDGYYGGPGYDAPYSAGAYGAYGDRYRAEEYGQPYEERARWRNSRERLPYPYGPETYGSWPEGRTADPRVLPYERGRLLPPEERLRRPWLYEDERVDPRSRPRYAPDPRR